MTLLLDTRNTTANLILLIPSAMFRQFEMEIMWDVVCLTSLSINSSVDYCNISDLERCLGICLFVLCLFVSLYLSIYVYIISFWGKFSDYTGMYVVLLYS